MASPTNSQLTLRKAVRVLLHGGTTNRLDYATGCRPPVVPHCPTGLLQFHSCATSFPTTLPLRYTSVTTNPMAVYPRRPLPNPGPLLLPYLPPKHFPTLKGWDCCSKTSPACSQAHEVPCCDDPQHLCVRQSLSLSLQPHGL